jgi:Family of unknown function (DUF6644)
MPLLAWCRWLEQTPLATAISESIWLFPLIEGSHILALPLSVGMILMFDLRLLGVAFRNGPAARMMADVVRWSKFGFIIMFTTGVVLFMTQASKAYGNAFFRTKLLLLLILGVNAAVYQIVFYPKMVEWDAIGHTPIGARICGWVSLIGWVSVITCGRTMAYQF